MSVHDRLGGRLNVHDRLGKRVGHLPRNQEELEEMADARVPDEFIFLQRCQYSSGRIKGSSLSARVEDKASPMVSRRVNKDTEKEDAVRTTRRID